MGLKPTLLFLAVGALMVGTTGVTRATDTDSALWVDGSRETESSGATTTGRPVRIVSLSFKSASLERVSALIEAEGRRGVDLVVLPETWRGTNLVEEMTGETITAMARLAKQHHTYVVSPIYRAAGDKRLNTAVVIDRSGQVVATYDKIFPYWNEFDMKPPARPGVEDATVFDADFGRIGLAICYDAKFPEVFQRLRERGAELVVWTSAYSGYTELQSCGRAPTLATRSCRPSRSSTTTRSSRRR
jgi:predicted amidohydrolase